MSKQKTIISNALLFALLGIYLVIVFTSEELPSKKVTFSFISAAMIISTFNALLSQEVGIRGYGVVKKSERPGLYWFQVVFLGIAGVACIILGFFV